MPRLCYSPWGNELLRHSSPILRRQVLKEVLSLARRVGVQQEGQPAHVALHARVADSLLQVALAHEAPGSHDVADHLHRHLRLARH